MPDVENTENVNLEEPQVAGKGVAEQVSEDNTFEVQTPADQVSEEHVQYHLDRDPNDPRTKEPTPKLPSLNDPGQS